MKHPIENLRKDENIYMNAINNQGQERTAVYVGEVISETKQSHLFRIINSDEYVTIGKQMVLREKRKNL